MAISVAVVGATGRLGSQVVRVIEAMPDMEVFAKLDSKSDLQEMVGANIAVDATRPDVSPKVVEFALANSLKVLVATSGWSADRLRELGSTVSQLSSHGVFVVPNFSVGSAIQLVAAKIAAESFESIEIVESHHPGKVDSPSGTAVRAAEEIAEVRARNGGVIAPFSNQTARGEAIDGIPVHSLRLKGVLARQDIIFGGVGESLTISHDTSSPQAYDWGIAIALRFLSGHSGLAVGLSEALGIVK